jgi:oligopeptide/dipeptide ABC transporter ATP-binding protein
VAPAAIEFRSVSFSRPERAILENVSFAVPAGETLALVGRSGAGKSTILKLINRLLEPQAGTILVSGRDTRAWDQYDLRRHAGYVLQEIGLFPHLTVGENVGIVPRLLGWEPARTRARSADLLALVGLPAAEFGERWPDELSGGQRQRVVIAGALVLEPEVIVADEPVSNLDASVRGEILQLLMKLRADLGLTIIIVTHDLGLAWTVADRVAIMYLGRIVEIGPAEDVLMRPEHPYTKALLDVVPEAGGLERPILTGEPPDPTRIPPGCRFHPRCPVVASGRAAELGIEARCKGEDLGLRAFAPEHEAACYEADLRHGAGAVTA